jgi:3-hydroxyacyl-CoA dehydrogenase
MSDLVSLERDGDVAVITINNPPVNALSPGVPEGIAASLEAVRSDAGVRAVVLIGGGRTFIAGADIKEFGKITSGERKRDIGLHPVLNTIENFPKPVVCAIHGQALGGGLETAMACHYRVAASSAKVGQPEVKLGLIPGAAGTQRLPRLVGVPLAAQMCVTGEPISAAKAHEAGLVDQIVQGDLRAAAIAFARQAASRGGTPPKSSQRGEKLADSAANGKALAEARKLVAQKARGLFAPQKAVDAIEAACTMSFEEGCRKEGALFNECLFSDQSKALIHVFFGERVVGKVPGIGKDTPVLPIKRAAVVGAGTMGGGITMAYANAGIPVLLKEVAADVLERGLATIRKNYATSVQRGRMTQEQVDQTMARITPTLSYDGFKEADIVVEAVFEEMALKKKVFAELDPVTRPGAILASNTSTLDIDQIASMTSRPGRVIGHHFFSPANVMRLLEIVRGKQTAPDVIATSLALARTLGKVGVLVGNCRGFVGNRMFHPYMREAQFLLEEGARVQQVDAAMVEFGMAMGPLAVGDLAGLDVGWRIRKEYRHLDPPGQRDLVVADRLCEMGRFGQKTGSGWYRYEAGSRAPVPDPEVERIIEECAKKAGIGRRAIATDEIIERTIYALVNEGAKILEEGFALRAADIDIIYINGYGFPAYRGGPMWYADTVGLGKVSQRVLALHKQHGDLWAPAPLLLKLGNEGKTFADWDKQRSPE